MGYRNPGGGVSILASGELLGLELSSEGDYDFGSLFDPFVIHQRRWWMLTARLLGFSWAKGAHYGEAFAKLFGMWDPDVPPPTRPALELEEGRRQLDAGGTIPG